MGTFVATDAPFVEGVLSGLVVEFDSPAGLGYIDSANGNRYLFHCIAIADDSREIAVGQKVLFEVVVRFEKSEAWNIQKND
ncbi:MAG: cold shock domain-containing protein [Actinomycetes bacterium]